MAPPGKAVAAGVSLAPSLWAHHAQLRRQHQYHPSGSGGAAIAELPWPGSIHASTDDVAWHAFSGAQCILRRSKVALAAQPEPVRGAQARGGMDPSGRMLNPFLQTCPLPDGSTKRVAACL